MHIKEARTGKIIVDSGFSGYDKCLNPYVGCQFGCKYCYVRFFIKDKEHPWGEFVRVRNHIGKLEKELIKCPNTRIVLGTMTDPYQPQERKYRITRKALTIIKNSPNKPKKIGIFTRSPIILDDLELLIELKAQVHFTVTPLPQNIIKCIEPIPIPIKTRLEVIEKLVRAGIKTCCNFAPAIPTLSEPLTKYLSDEAKRINIDEFFVDPIQAYTESKTQTLNSLIGIADTTNIATYFDNKEKYEQWKNTYYIEWYNEWKEYTGKTLPIWSDHITSSWINLKNGNPLNRKNYD